MGVRRARGKNFKVRTGTTNAVPVRHLSYRYAIVHNFFWRLWITLGVIHNYGRYYEGSKVQELWGINSVSVNEIGAVDAGGSGYG